MTAPVINDGTANYTPGVSERRSGSTKFVNADRLGSTTHLTDSTEATTGTREYDAYAQTVSSTGSTATPFGFVGKAGYQQDADSGLLLLGHRYYDSSTGRFITRDPAKDGRNWWTYAANKPSKGLDPAGLEALSDEQYVQVMDALELLKEHGHKLVAASLQEMMLCMLDPYIEVDKLPKGVRGETRGSTMYLNSANGTIWYHPGGGSASQEDKRRFSAKLQLASTIFHEYGHWKRCDGPYPLGIGQRADERRQYTKERDWMDYLISKGNLGATKTGLVEEWRDQLDSEIEENWK